VDVVLQVSIETELEESTIKDKMESQLYDSVGNVGDSEWQGFQLIVEKIEPLG